MAGIPAYPADWASELSSIRQQLNATAASAQTRVGYTGGSLPGALSVGQALTAAGGLGVTGTATVTGAATVSGAVTAGSVAATGAVTGGSATIAGAVTADDLIGDTLTVGGNTIDLAELALALNPPGDELVKGGAQSIAATTLTTVTGLTYTAPSAGRYTATGAVLWDNDPDGRREANLVIGGTTYRCTSVHSNANTPIWTPVAATGPMTAGQTVTITVWHSAGNPLDVLADTRLEVVRVGPL